jgi:NitT/TauT family transport system ATP-binding protein
MKTKLQICSVSKNFSGAGGKKIEAVKKVSVQVKDKEFVAIVGPSGCGKTTLLKAVAGLLKPSEGEIYLNGKLVMKPSRNRGLVFQHPTSFPWLSVLENVEFGLKLQNTDEKKRKQAAEQLIDLVGLSGSENSNINSLSGGMKQRVAIATVLANNPDVLLMDEPFSALDAQTRGLMQELILTIREETKKTVLFVTHDIDEAIFLADRVYIMSAKPGEIKDVVNVRLPRPRTPEMKLSEDFIKIKKHISYIIRGESIKAAQVKLEAIRPKAIKIGVHTWPGNMPFYLADELGLYKKHGLEVELISQEKEEDRITSLENGEVDLLNLTADTAAIAKEKGLDLQLFLCLNKSVGGDAIIVKKHIKKIEELKGRNIAVERGWVSHFFLLHVLDKYGLDEKDVKVVHMKGSDIGAALISDKVDAAVLWEPWLTQAKRLSGSYSIISSKEEPVVLDVLATTREILRNKPEKIRKIVRVWFESLSYLDRKQERANKIMAIPLGISHKEIKEQFQGLDFIELKMNKRLLGPKTKKGTLYKTLERSVDVWYRNKIIKERYKVDDFLNNSFL